MATSDQNAHTEAMNRLAASNEAAFAAREKKDKEDSKAKFAPGKLVGALAKNSASVLGLSQGLTSLKGFFGQAAKDNTQIVKQLSQFTVASKTTTRQLIESVNTGYTTFQEGIATQGELIKAGMGDMSKGNKENFVAMKALGFDLRAAVMTTRFNNETLGLSVEASTGLARSLVETSIANSSSFDSLINAIQSMKKALVKTTIELGPEMALKMQRLVARMSQDNSDMAAANAAFVSSFVAGEEGVIKAMRFGERFSKNMTDEAFEATFERIIAKANRMQEGAQGGIHFQRLEDAMMMSRDDFNVAKQNKLIKELKVQNMKDAADLLKDMDASRQMEVAMFQMQAKGVDFMQGVGAVLSPLSHMLPLALTFLGTISAMTTVMAMKNSAGLGTFGAMKMAKGAGAMGMAGLGMAGVGKDSLDILTGSDGGMTGENIGGALLGALAGGIGFGLGGFVGAGILGALGNAAGSYLGSLADTKKTNTHLQEANQTYKEILDLEEKTANDTAEIRRIQEKIERRAETLANPQMRILTSISDTLRQNLAVLQSSNRQQNLTNEHLDNAQYNAPIVGTTFGPINNLFSN